MLCAACAPNSMQTLSYSVILAYRDRDTARLQACLESLARQTSASGFEVIVIDSGSGTGYAEEARRVCERLGASIRYAYAETQGQPWNRSQTLNLGAALAQGDWLIFGDIDLIYPPDFLQKLKTLCVPGVKYNYRCRYLPEGEGRTDYAELAKVHADAELSRDTGLGLSLLSKQDFEAVGGFDERFLIWGVEDIALHYRVEKAGIRTAWVPEQEVVTFHIWHPHATTLLPKNWYSALWNWYEESRDLPPARYTSWTSLAERGLHRDRGQSASKVVVLNDDAVAHTHAFLHALEAADTGSLLVLHADRLRLRTRAWVTTTNRWLEKLGVGFRLYPSQFQSGLWEPEYRYRTTMLMTVLYHRDRMQDFYLEDTEQHLRLYVRKA